jgi:hypothetical protein
VNIARFFFEISMRARKRQELVWLFLRVERSED